MHRFLLAKLGMIRRRNGYTGASAKGMKMVGVGGLSGRTMSICPGCGYPVLGPQPCAACAPLVTAAQGVLLAAGPIVAA